MELKNIDIGCGLIALSKEKFMELNLDYGKRYQLESWIKIQILSDPTMRIMSVPVDCNYHKKPSGIKKGLKMFFQVSIFILVEGFRLRLWNRKNYRYWLKRTKNEDKWNWIMNRISD